MSLTRTISLARARRPRRGFSIVELLVALAITGALLTATLFSLNMCFIAYKATTEEASTNTVARLVMHRILTLVRTGTEFGPLPDDPRDVVTTSDFIEFRTHSGQLVRIEFVEGTGSLTYSVDNGTPQTLLGGVQRTEEDLPPFTLEYDKGTRLYRLSMDITVIPDDSQSTGLDEGMAKPLRLVASAMPRQEAW